jgi:hypothetical protein
MFYTGRLILELNSAVDRAEAKVLADFDKLIADCNPVTYLAQVKSHIFGGDSSDVDARVILTRIQDCLRTGLADVCDHCGQLEGLHSFAGNFCPTEDWYSRTSIFEKVEDQNERIIRAGLDSWLQNRAGC